MNKKNRVILSAVLLLALMHCANATPMPWRFGFGGVVTSFSSDYFVDGVRVGPYPGPVFAPGDPFTGILTYDASLPRDEGAFTFSINLGFGAVFNTIGGFTMAEILIRQAPGEEFALSPYDGLVDTFAYLTLVNKSAPFAPVPSKDYVNLSNYPDEHDVWFFGGITNEPNTDGDFDMTGDITSLHSIPDSSSTFSVFALSLMSLAVLRRKFC